MRRAYSAGVRPASTGSAPTRRRCAVRGARKGGRSRQGGRDDAPVATPARRARRFRPLASLAPTAALVDGRRRLRSAAAAAALLCAGRSSSWVSRPESLGHARWDDRDGRFQPRDHTMAGAPVVANGGGEGGREGESRGFCSSLSPPTTTGSARETIETASSWVNAPHVRPGRLAPSPHPLASEIGNRDLPLKKESRSVCPPSSLLLPETQIEGERDSKTTPRDVAPPCGPRSQAGTYPRRN